MVRASTAISAGRVVVVAGAAALVVVLLCAAPAPAAVEAVPAGAEVSEFPGFDGDLPSKHYAGYITVGHQPLKRHMYYYFATSERNSTTDPVIIWINGGPACSGFSAFLHSIGPFKIEGPMIHARDEPRTKLNPFSWTKMSSVLLVDSPAGVGYSYSENEDDYVTNDTSRVLDLYDFLSKWFSEYLEFLSNPFYIAGCSYSGVIVPVLAQEILKRNEDNGRIKINFKGYSLCNPAVDVEIENNAFVPYAFRMGLISDELYQNLVSTCNGKYWNNKGPSCLANLEQFHKQISGINMEHILCPPCRYQMGITKEANEEYDFGQMFELLSESTEYGLECNNQELVLEKLFDTKSSREKLHAKPIEILQKWKRCPNFIQYTRDIPTLTEYHLNVTSKGYRVFLYSGDHALLVPFSATLEWLKTLNYKEIEKWHPWFVEKQIAGYSVRYENNILFATIKGAGHVPSDYLPFEVFVAYQRWIDGSDSL
uniref:carboxypeptidase D n=2 Tax=Oryza glaberrima TaxID=4538 RepID=I1P082_ORYGL